MSDLSTNLFARPKKPEVEDVSPDVPAPRSGVSSKEENSSAKTGLAKIVPLASRTAEESRTSGAPVAETVLPPVPLASTGTSTETSKTSGGSETLLPPVPLASTGTSTETSKTSGSSETTTPEAKKEEPKTDFEKKMGDMKVVEDQLKTLEGDYATQAADIKKQQEEVKAEQIELAKKQDELKEEGKIGSDEAKAALGNMVGKDSEALKRVQEVVPPGLTKADAARVVESGMKELAPDIAGNIVNPSSNPENRNEDEKIRAEFYEWALHNTKGTPEEKVAQLNALEKKADQQQAQRDIAVQAAIKNLAAKSPASDQQSIADGVKKLNDPKTTPAERAHIRDALGAEVGKKVKTLDGRIFEVTGQKDRAVLLKGEDAGTGGIVEQKVPYEQFRIKLSESGEFLADRYEATFGTGLDKKSTTGPTSTPPATPAGTPKPTPKPGATEPVPATSAAPVAPGSKPSAAPVAPVAPGSKPTATPDQNQPKGGSPATSNLPNGKGVWKGQNNVTYDGEMVNGKPNGYGRMSTASGDGTTSGNGNDGVLTREGGVKSGDDVTPGPENLVIEGNWKDGSLVNGNITYPSGSSYKGDMKGDQKHGKGEYIIPGEGREEGVYVNGILNTGNVYDAKGELKATYQDGEMINSSTPISEEAIDDASNELSRPDRFRRAYPNDPPIPSKHNARGFVPVEATGSARPSPAETPSSPPSVPAQTPSAAPKDTETSNSSGNLDWETRLNPGTKTKEFGNFKILEGTTSSGEKVAISTRSIIVGKTLKEITETTGAKNLDQGDIRFSLDENGNISSGRHIDSDELLNSWELSLWKEKLVKMGIKLK